PATRLLPLSLHDALPISEKYFGKIELAPRSDTIVTTVPDYMTASTLARALDLPISRLRELNPALSDAVWSGNKLVPRGFPLRLPDRKSTRLNSSHVKISY